MIIFQQCTLIVNLFRLSSRYYFLMNTYNACCLNLHTIALQKSVYNVSFDEPRLSIHHLYAFFASIVFKFSNLIHFSWICYSLVNLKLCWHLASFYFSFFGVRKRCVCTSAFMLRHLNHVHIHLC